MRRQPLAGRGRRRQPGAPRGARGPPTAPSPRRGARGSKRGCHEQARPLRPRRAGPWFPLTEAAAYRTRGPLPKGRQQQGRTERPTSHLSPTQEDDEQHGACRRRPTGYVFFQPFRGWHGEPPWRPLRADAEGVLACLLLKAHAAGASSAVATAGKEEPSSGRALALVSCPALLRWEALSDARTALDRLGADFQDAEAHLRLADGWR